MAVRLRRSPVCSATLLLVAASLGSPGARGGEPVVHVGVLLSEGAADRRQLEHEVARDLARRLARPTFLRSVEGRLVDGDGREAPLDRFAVLWCHQGEPEQPGPPLLDAGTMASLRGYVAGGRGVLLSGAAAASLEALGGDAVRIQPLPFGNDREQAGVIPLVPEHPAFRGLEQDRGVVWLTNAVYPTFEEFQVSGGPGRVTMLAQAAGGPALPLLECSIERGRAIVMPWRLSPHYASAAAGYRESFERLTSNLLAYLSSPGEWRTQAPGAAGAGPEAEIPEAAWRSLELAIADLRDTFGDRYPRAAEFLERIAALKRAHGDLQAGGRTGNSLDRDVGRIRAELERLRAEALLLNPLLDFDRLLVLRRGAAKLGLPMNYLSNSSLEPAGYENEICILSPVRPGGTLTPIFRPEGGRFVGDVDLSFDADRLLFSMPDANARWQVFEMRVDGSGLRQLPLIREPDVDNYDACYLPDGRIIFTSTACFTGVPCVGGSAHVANLYLLETGGRIRQLTVDQDHDWCPTVLNDGRVLYLRWEYADTPHAFSRILFHMNPDGTGQMEYYGSSSYWPASMFYARPVPGHPSKVVAVVGGHHELPRMGDLVIFDPALGRLEAQGAVQRIPGHGRKVEPTLLDLPIAQTWPKFLHPFPLSEKHFLVSCKLAESAPWGVYLCDVFDNMVLIHEEPDRAILEPIPLRRTLRPPVRPDRIDLGRRDAEVLITDVHLGEGMKGVPRGTVRSLRLISYTFAYQGMGAEPDSVGMDGPWDPKVILGTVPVHEDGSARFRVPACTPIAVQPLDAEGKAVQLMRSWFTAMPGEHVACVGCHEQQNSAPPVRTSLAQMRPAEEIRPWYGPPRGLDFRREIQPVLDRYCLGCHDGRERPDGRSIPDLRDSEPAPIQKNDSVLNLRARFSRSYYELRRLVRTPTKESDLHVLPPWSFHADTTRLVQMLVKGHHGVRLPAEAWDRLITWIDVNAPAHGTWTDICGEARVKGQADRRRTLRKLLVGMDEDPEAVPAPAPSRPSPIVPDAPPGAALVRVDCPGGIFDAEEARRRQGGGREPAGISLRLSGELDLELVRIPAGELVLGEADRCEDERPPCRVAIRSPFWMSCHEITNEQFALFDPTHDSRLENGDYIQFSPGERGWPLSLPRQPVVRVSWRQVTAFCRWLSEKTGRRFELPTEAQWEYACRAGTATALWYGPVEADFSRFANVSDASHQAIDPFGWAGRVDAIPPWRPADARFDDGSRVTSPVGRYLPNPWGLFDMHGNAAEWTRSEYRPYPYDAEDGREGDEPGVKKVVRGGSWYDPPDRCRTTFRQAYRAEQPVFDVGFRVICLDALD